MGFFEFLDFFRFLDLLKFFEISLNFFLGFFRIPFKFTNVTTKSYDGYYRTPKIAKKGLKQHNKVFFAQRAKKDSAKGRSSPQELEVGPRSGLYLLVFYKTQKGVDHSVTVLIFDTRIVVLCPPSLCVMLRGPPGF